MDSFIKNCVANKYMHNKFSASKKASWLETLFMKISVKRTVFLSLRKTHEDGQYVVQDGYSQYIEKFADGIAYEWFCNELYFRPVKRFGSFSRTVEYILETITKRLKRFKGREFCVCLSLDEESDSITVHFHTYHDELYISDDIEGFVQPVLYMIIQT